MLAIDLCSNSSYVTSWLCDLLQVSLLSFFSHDFIICKMGIDYSTLSHSIEDYKSENL